MSGFWRLFLPTIYTSLSSLQTILSVTSFFNGEIALGLFLLLFGLAGFLLAEAARGDL